MKRIPDTQDITHDKSDEIIIQSGFVEFLFEQQNCQNVTETLSVGLSENCWVATGRQLVLVSRRFCHSLSKS